MLGAYLRGKVLHSGRLRPYLQTLDEAGKACQGQTLHGLYLQHFILS